MIIDNPMTAMDAEFDGKSGDGTTAYRYLSPFTCPHAIREGG